MSINTQFIDLTSRANNGEKDAIEHLHLEYAHENDAKQIFDEELVNFYKDNKNKPYSTYFYGKMCLSGLGVIKNVEKGMIYIKKAKKLGCSEAYVLLAVLVDSGLCDGDSQELINNSCESGNINGFYWKGIFEKNKGNDKEYIKCMKIVGKKGYEEGYHQIGQYYHDNEDYDMARKFYNISMAMGSSHSYLNMSVIFRIGEGCDIDMKKAIKLLKKSDELGNVKASVCLGSIYIDMGKVSKGKKYYEKAIKEEDPLAYYNLGLVYQDEDEEKKSIQMFLCASRLGHFESIRKLQQLDIDPMTDDDDLDYVIANRDHLREVFKNFGAFN